ncbi:uncharacterized protein LOC143068275 [Mytilus galloprovincialis]|uniref:Uncharacterized protein n=1 Tax=Mytilus galloprovincialis TaxID=29158 RepID=A0A8B6C1H2_MYTGA|nr:Hypothetical predicted protein [Mytilus galloprovincialis]
MFIVSVYFKVAFALICVGLVFEVIGFASPYWQSWDNRYGDTNNGLWQQCSDQYKQLRHGDRCYKYGRIDTALGAARAFSAIAVILFVVLLILLLIYWCQCPRSDLILACIIISFITAACAFIGVICWASEYDHNLSWAFYLCVIAGILAVIAGILLIPERRIIVIGRTTTGGASTVRTVTTTRTVTVR